jgi:hypothetical protein
MLSPLRALLRAVARFRPRPAWWLGRPHRATIARAASGGYRLLIHHDQGVEWIDLPERTEPYEYPDDREFTAATDALADRRLVWVLPWQLDQHGNLTAPLARVARQETTR